MAELEESLNALKLFFGTEPREKIKELRETFSNTGQNQIIELLSTEKINFNLLESAYLIKQISSQIDTKIHCIVILFLLGKIIKENVSKF